MNSDGVEAWQMCQEERRQKKKEKHRVNNALHTRPREDKKKEEGDERKTGGSRETGTRVEWEQGREGRRFNVG